MTTQLKHKKAPVAHKAIVIYPEYVRTPEGPIYTVAPFVMSDDYDTFFDDARKAIGCDLIEIVECGIKMMPGGGKYASFDPRDSKQAGDTQFVIACSDNGDSFKLPSQFCIIVDEEGGCKSEPKFNKLASIMAFLAGAIPSDGALFGKVVIVPLERTLDEHYDNKRYMGS